MHRHVLPMDLSLGLAQKYESVLRNCMPEDRWDFWRLPAPNISFWEMGRFGNKRDTRKVIKTLTKETKKTKIKTCVLRTSLF